MVKIAFTSNAVNLARRFSAMNENDMTNAMFDYEAETKDVYTYNMCAEIASRLTNSHFLPRDCQQYENLVKQVEIKRRDTTHSTSVL
mmetsp:Transcript_29464/g.42149  ORF Transcript_29464/g.42149 Transcript_29464/m.42149 type:complete len:87 (+) Transcript_29464:189-449(+)